MRITLPDSAAVVRLYKHVGDRLIACEAMIFPGGKQAIETTFRRAEISGRVDVGGDIKDHFADVLDADGDMIETVALDAKSYNALKNRWMRCKLDTEMNG